MPHATSAPHANSNLRLRLGAIGLILFTLLLGCFSLWRSQRNSIVHWEEFSANAKAAALAQKDAVIIMAYPRYNPMSGHVWRKLEHRDLAHLAGGRRYKAMVLDYGDWSSPDVRALFRDVGHTKTCFVAVYLPNEPPRKIDIQTHELTELRPNSWFPN